MKKAWSSIKDEDYKQRVREIHMEGVRDALKSNPVLHCDEEEGDDIDLSSTQLDDLPTIRDVPSNKRSVIKHGKSLFASLLELIDVLLY